MLCHIGSKHIDRNEMQSEAGKAKSSSESSHAVDVLLMVSAAGLLPLVPVMVICRRFSSSQLDLFLNRFCDLTGNGAYSDCS